MVHAGMGISEFCCPSLPILSFTAGRFLPIIPGFHLLVLSWNWRSRAGHFRDRETSGKTRLVDRIKNLKPVKKEVVKEVEVKEAEEIKEDKKLDSRHISLEYSVSDDHLLDDEEDKQGGQGE